MAKQQVPFRAGAGAMEWLDAMLVGQPRDVSRADVIRACLALGREQEEKVRRMIDRLKAADR